MTGFDNSLTPSEIRLVGNLCQEIQELTLNEMMSFNTSNSSYKSGRQLYLWSLPKLSQEISEKRLLEVGQLALKVSQLSYNALYQLSRSMIHMKSFTVVHYGIGIIPPPTPCEEE